MRKWTLAIGLLLHGLLLSQQVHVVSNLEEYREGQALFSHSSPFKILQDISFKNHIELTCISKEHSKLYKPEKVSRWKEMIRSWFSEEKQWVQLTSNPKDKLIYFNLPEDLKVDALQKIPSDRQILFAFNAASVKQLKASNEWQSLFYKIYTSDPSLADDTKIFYTPMPSLLSSIQKLPPNTQREGVSLVREQDTPLSDQEKTLINYYTAVAAKQFHLYGNKARLGDYASYKGGNLETAMSSHRFTLCLQSTPYLDESLTKQVFSSFTSLTVPVIEGSDAIYSLIPKHCFIDKKDFSDEQQLLLFLNSMTEENFEEYQSRIRTFLQSPEASIFSVDHFAKVFLEATSY